TPALASVNTSPASGCPRAIVTGSTPAAGCTGYVPTTFLIGGPFDIINLGTAAAPQLFQATQYQRTVPDPYIENYSNLRFDVKASNKDSITVRYLKQSQDNVAGTGTTSAGWLGDVPFTSKHFGGDWTRTWSSRFVTEFRPNYQRIGGVFGGGCKTGTPGCIPDPLDIAVALARIDFSGSLGLTKSNALGSIGPA